MIDVLMLAGVRNWFRQHGLIILVLILGLLGSLVLVWWRLGFTLEVFQPFAAVPCNPGDSCGGHGCGTGGLCNKCGFPGASGAQADADCAGNSHSCTGSNWYCVSEGKGFNHCVEDTSTCVPTGGGGGGGGGTSAQAQFSVTNKNYTPGGCDTASSLGSSAHANVNVTDAGNVNTHIVFNVFHSDTAGCAATNQQPSGGGSKTGICDFAPHGTGVCQLSYAIGTHNCGRVQFDAAFSDGASGVFIGQVIDYGVDCADVAPPTHLECVNNSCQSVSGSGTNQCNSDADCGITVVTHMACENNACVVKTGAGTNECTTDTDCTLPELSCAPATQDVTPDEDANFTATGGTGTYAWTATSGSPASGAGGTFSTAYGTDGIYTVSVTSGAQTAECEVTVTSEEEQELVCSPASQTVNIGEMADLSVSGGTGSYQWAAPSGNPTSGQGGTFGVSYDDEGSYTVTVRDTETQLSDECRVDVQPEETPEETRPELDIDKFVITRGGSEVNTRSADPNEVIEFIYYVTSNGDEDLRDVRTWDAIPTGLTYRSGTARLNGGAISDGEFLSQIDLGDMSPGEEHTISFAARVAADSFFDFGSTTLVNRAFADADNTSEVDDTAFVTVSREPENPTLSLRKLGRNVSRNQAGEHTSVEASPNNVIEFTIRVRNTSDAIAENVYVQDIVPQGVTYQAGTAALNGQPTSDVLVNNGVNIGDLNPSQEAIIRFLGRVVPVNQLPTGTTTLINIARTWADSIPTLQAQLPIIIYSQPVTIPPVETGPGETTVLALIISAIVTLMYVGYTSSAAFRRHEALDISRKPGNDFR